MYNVDLYLHFQSNLYQSKSSKLGPRGPSKKNPLIWVGFIYYVVVAGLQPPHFSLDYSKL